MAGIRSGWITKHQWRAVFTVLNYLAALCVFLPLSAQQQGPMNAPAGMAAPPSEPKPAAAAPTQDAASKHTTAVASKEPPSIPIDEIIRRFAAREAEFKTERDNFTYTQTFIIQTLDGGRVDGEYRMTSEIVFTPEGKRYEKVTNAPTPTLERITLLEKNQRYFQGRVWVDDKDFEIVKTDGKAVPDIKKKGQENVFPRFETFRENVEGNYWFPTYTRSNDVLHFSSGDIPIRMTVRYENYKRFGVTVKIGAPVKKIEDKP